MIYKLGQLLNEVCEKTTENNQYPVLTSSKSGIFLQENYFTKNVASKDNTGYKIIKRGQFTYRSMSDTGLFFINCLDCIDVGIVSPAYPVFEIKDEKVLFREYLIYFFRSEGFNRKISSLSKGSTRLSLKYKDLKNIEIDLPSFEIQLSQAKALKEIDDLIKNCTTRFNDCDELIKAHFIDAFVDKGYDEVILGDEIKTTSGGTPTSSKYEYYEGGTIPWLTSGEVNQGIIYKPLNFITEAGLNNSSAKMVPENSVVIAMYGATAGKVGLVRYKTTTNQAVCVLLPNKEFVPEYLMEACAINEDWMISNCNGAGQPNISQTIIKKMKLIKAPFEMQKEFARFVDEIGDLKKAVTNQKAAAEELLSAVMEDYFG